MPRAARKKSSTAIYHVILRGINQQIIFEEDEDYRQFLNILKYYKKECNYKIYAYCLMNNHVHLLIEEGSEKLEILMKRIQVKFVRWYNQKYQRSGYLFQDRYKSEPVEDMRYFLTVFRYIHQNPICAGIESRLGEYKWSSYRNYVMRNAGFVEVEQIILMFSSHEGCIEFLNTTSKEKCLENYSFKRLPDEVALAIIREITHCKSPSDFQHLDLCERDLILSRLLKEGLSIRQLSRLTGLNKKTIEKSKKGTLGTVFNVTISVPNVLE